MVAHLAHVAQHVLFEQIEEMLEGGSVAFEGHAVLAGAELGVHLREGAGEGEEQDHVVGQAALLYLACDDLFALPFAGQPPTKADVIALVAHRLRVHYRARLLHLFALKDDPYESQGESFAVYFLAVLRNEKYDHPTENRATSELSEAINHELGYAYVATIYVASEDDYEQRATGSVLAAQEEGVAL